MIRQVTAIGMTVAAAALCAGAASVARAQSSADEEPAGIPLGPLRAYPALDLSLQHNDNLFLTNTNRRSSYVTVITPSMKLEGRSGPNTYSLFGKYEDGTVHSSRADDYTNKQLFGIADLQPTDRFGLKVNAEHLESYDPRGTTNRPSSTDPDRWTQQSIAGVLGYGAPEAQGRFELEAAYLTRRYDNNRAFTEGADRDNSVLGATFFYRIAPKTRLLFQYKHTEIDYQLATSLQSSRENRYLIGATWEATAATTGIFKFGHVSKDFRSAGRTDFSGVTWEGTVRWSPLERSNFDFSTGREPREATGLGDFILSRYYSAAWNHAWSSRLSSAVNYRNTRDEFRGGGATRVDDINSLGGRLSYSMLRWLTINAEYQYSRRNANTAGDVDDYRKNLLLFSLRATL